MPPWDKYQQAPDGPWSKYQDADKQGGDQRGMIDKLFGIGGPRYQTWPERLVRGIGESVESAEELTKETMEGQQFLDPQSGKVMSPAEAQPGKTLNAATFGLSAAPGAGEGLGAAADLAAKSQQIKAVLPSTEAIKASSQAAYKAIADTRLIASQGSLNNLVSATRAGLDERLFNSTTSPRTFQALEQLAKSGGDIANIMNVYQRLGEIKPTATNATDFEAALHVKDAINNYIDTLPDSEIVSGGAGAADLTAAMWKHAKASWRSYAQLDQVQSAMQVGEHKAAVAGVGANTQNAMRQRIRQVVDSGDARRFSREAKDQLEKILMGTWLTNAARYVGKFAPSGPVSAMTTTMAALGADLAGGHGAAAGAAAAVAIPATIAKYLGTYLTKRQISELENIIRAESPIGKAAKTAVEARPRYPDAAVLSNATPALVPSVAADITVPPTPQWQPPQQQSPLASPLQ